jgi:hypothetical protein
MKTSIFRTLLKQGNSLSRLFGSLAAGAALIAIGNLASYPAHALQANGRHAITYTTDAPAAAPVQENETETKDAVPDAGTPDFSLTSSPSTLTITQGKTGVETLTLTALNGFASNVQLTASASSVVETKAQICAALDSESATQIVLALTFYTYPYTCPVASPALKIAGRPEAVSLNREPGNQSPNHSIPERAGIAVAGLFLAGLIGRRSRKLRGVAGLMVLIVLSLSLSSCGGSSKPVNNPNDLPFGSYSITIIGTDSADTALTHSTTFTVVVN